VISGNPALAIPDAAAHCNGDLSTDRNPKFALLEDLPPYEDVGSSDSCVCEQAPVCGVGDSFLIPDEGGQHSLRGTPPAQFDA
jgi:hypothetical protein